MNPKQLAALLKAVRKDNIAPERTDVGHHEQFKDLRERCFGLLSNRPFPLSHLKFCLDGYWSLAGANTRSAIGRLCPCAPSHAAGLSTYSLNRCAS